MQRSLGPLGTLATAAAVGLLLAQCGGSAPPIALEFTATSSAATSTTERRPAQVLAAAQLARPQAAAERLEQWEAPATDAPTSTQPTVDTTSSTSAPATSTSAAPVATARAEQPAPTSPPATAAPATTASPAPAPTAAPTTAVATTPPPATAPPATPPPETAPPETAPPQTAPPETAPPASSSASSSPDAIALTNQQRAASGMSALTSNGALSNAAAQHSVDQANRNSIGHEGSDGSRAGDRIRANGGSFSTWSENVASGYGSASGVVGGWMDSSGHRDNILNPAFTQIGVAVAYAADGTSYWTMVLTG